MTFMKANAAATEEIAKELQKMKDEQKLAWNCYSEMKEAESKKKEEERVAARQRQQKDWVARVDQSRQADQKAWRRPGQPRQPRQPGGPPPGRERPAPGGPEGFLHACSMSQHRGTAPLGSSELPRIVVWSRSNAPEELRSQELLNNILCLSACDCFAPGPICVDQEPSEEDSAPADGAVPTDASRGQQMSQIAPRRDKGGKRSVWPPELAH